MQTHTREGKIKIYQNIKIMSVVHDTNSTSRLSLLVPSQCQLWHKNDSVKRHNPFIFPRPPSPKFFPACRESTSFGEKTKESYACCLVCPTTRKQTKKCAPAIAAGKQKNKKTIEL